MSSFILLMILWPFWTSALLKANLTFVLDKNNPNSLPICTIKSGLESVPCDDGSTIISLKQKQLFQIACGGFGLFQLGTFPCALSREQIDERCASKFAKPPDSDRNDDLDLWTVIICSRGETRMRSALHRRSFARYLQAVPTIVQLYGVWHGYYTTDHGTCWTGDLIIAFITLSMWSIGRRRKLLDSASFCLSLLWFLPFISRTSVHHSTDQYDVSLFWAMSKRHENFWWELPLCVCLSGSQWQMLD